MGGQPHIEYFVNWIVNPIVGHNSRKYPGIMSQRGSNRGRSNQDRPSLVDNSPQLSTCMSSLLLAILGSFFDNLIII